MNERKSLLPACLPEAARERFELFALSHFVISGLSALVSLMLFSVAWGLLVLVLITLFFYTFCGFELTKDGKLGRPTPGLMLVTFALPAAVALAWGFGGMGLLVLVPGLEAVGVVLLLSTALFAHPSFAIMFLNLQYYTISEPAWYAWILVAAILPPALFALGTLLGGLGQDRATLASL